jgi:predicted exporter
MKRSFAFLWILTLVLFAVFLGWRLSSGLELRTNLMALLPDEQRNPVVEETIKRASREASRQVIFLVGHEDEATARSGASQFSTAMSKTKDFSKVASKSAGGDAEAFTRILRQHAGGLLAITDRDLLQAGQGRQIVQRSLAQVYGGFSLVDGRTLKADPFLLLPSFLNELPDVLGNLTIKEGYLSVTSNGMTWILVNAVLAEDPMSIRFHKHLIEAVDKAEAVLPDGSQLLRSGVVFFAERGAKRALQETSTFGLASLIFVIFLLFAVFRSGGPLLVNVFAIASGVVCASASAVLVFGELHVFTLLFGSSLIGVSVDYGLHYCCERYGTEQQVSRRLRRILPGLILGLATTVLGYLCLVAAPLPGLRQLSVFTVTGLLASFLTVVLLFPLFDRASNRAMPKSLIRIVQFIWHFWDRVPYQWVGAVCLLLVMLPMLLLIRPDDDVRNMQSLDATVLATQKQVSRLTGLMPDSRFLIISATSNEGALIAAENLSAKLDTLIAENKLVAWQGLSQWVPSQMRQAEDRDLIADRLDKPYRDAQAKRLGIKSNQAASKWLPLLPEHLSGVVPVTRMMNGEGRHVISLSGLRDLRDGLELASESELLTFVDPAHDASVLLERYRIRTQYLLFAAVLLTLLLLVWRYGVVGGFRALVPSAIAMTAALAVSAIAGVPVSLFTYLALILVMAVGQDYAIFCRESDRTHRDTTLLAILMAGSTTVLSFGMLSLSSVTAVHQFGLTMLIGTSVSVLLAPFASGGKTQ